MPKNENLNESPSIITSIAPWLLVQDGAQAVGFYKSAFSAAEVYHLEDPDGAVVSRLSVNGAEFWLSGESQGNSNFETPVNGPIRMILTVNDPDAFFAQALKAGATEVYPVAEEHGWRSGRLVDPFGYHWEISRPITD